MAPIENPSISEIIPRRPGRSYYYPTRHETLRFGDGDIIMPASNNPPPFPVPYPDDSSQHVAPPGTFPSANYHFFPPLTPQNPIQQSADRQSIVVRHSSFDNSVLTLSASRCIHPYIEAVLTATLLVWPLLRYLLKLPFLLYLFILEIRSIVPRFYSTRFNYTNCRSYSEAERGDIGHNERLWANQAQAIKSDYVTIAAGSTGAVSVLVAILQLQATTSNAYATTLIYSAIIFVIHGVSCSVMYIGYSADMSGPGVASAWSETINDSAPLWQVLALPLVFVLWATAFTCAGMFLVAWTNNNAGASGDPTSSAPTTPLTAAGGMSTAPPPAPLPVPGPDLTDRLSVPLRRVVITLFFIYGIWRIIDARKKLAVMARTDRRRDAVRGAITASDPAVGDSG